MSALKVRPPFAVVYEANGTMGYTEHARDGALANLAFKGKYFLRLIFCELGQRVPMAAPVVAVSHALAHVSSLVAPCHMRRIATSKVAVSAQMQCERFCIWGAPVSNFTSQPVNVDQLPVHSDLSIAVSGPGKRPDQTLIAALHKHASVEEVQNIFSFCGWLFRHVIRP